MALFMTSFHDRESLIFVVFAYILITDREGERCGGSGCCSCMGVRLIYQKAEPTHSAAGARHIPTKLLGFPLGD